MRFIVHKHYKIELFREEELDHVKEHIEIVYSHIKDYLDNLDSEENLTIVDQDSPLAYTQIYAANDNVFDRDMTKMYNGVGAEIRTRATRIYGDDSDIRREDEIFFFDQIVTPLFEKYGIFCYMDLEDITKHELETSFINI